MKKQTILKILSIFLFALQVGIVSVVVLYVFTLNYFTYFLYPVIVIWVLISSIVVNSLQSLVLFFTKINFFVLSRTIKNTTFGMWLLVLVILITGVWVPGFDMYKQKYIQKVQHEAFEKQSLIDKERAEKVGAFEASRIVTISQSLKQPRTIKKFVEIGSRRPDGRPGVQIGALLDDNTIVWVNDTTPEEKDEVLQKLESLHLEGESVRAHEDLNSSLYFCTPNKVFNNSCQIEYVFVSLDLVSKNRDLQAYLYCTIGWGIATPAPNFCSEYK